MAIAWCLTEIYIFDNQKVEKILNLKYLNAFVINKTIDKIRDSYRVEKVKKNYLKQWKVWKNWQNNIKIVEINCLKNYILIQ